MSVTVSYSRDVNPALPTFIAGTFPRVTAKRTVVSGAGALVAGSVLGKVTADGKLRLSLAAATDGSEDVYAVLAEDIDATSADKDATVYLSGEFRAAGLTLGTGHTAASTRDAARALGIYY